MRSSRRKEALTVLLSTALVALLGAARAEQIFNVHDFGAKGDGAASDTEAIQQAIDTCSGKGGGVVDLPPGKYVSGTILLKDNTLIRLETNAVLLGSLNIQDYQAPDKFRSGNGAEMGYCFIGAVRAKNIVIEGGGVIDGRGKELLASRPKGVNARPFLARFVGCDGVSVRGVYLQGPAAWTMHFSQCKNVRAEHVVIHSRGLPNNDGMDIDSSEDVHIQNCEVDSGDDSICLKTTSTVPCRNIEVSDCDLTSHWAAIKFGTESVANFEDVTITHCRIHDTQGGGIKLFSVDGANVRNVLISGLVMDQVNFPIFIRLGARLKTFRQFDEPREVGSITNVIIRDLQVRATSPIGIMISGIPGHTVNGVTLENIDLDLPGGGTRVQAAAILPEAEAAYPEITMFGKLFPASGIWARHVAGLKVDGVKLHLAAPDLRPAIFCQEAEDAAFTNWKLPANADADCLVKLDSMRKALLEWFAPEGEMHTFLQVEGETSDQIGLKNNSLAGAKTAFDLSTEVKPGAVRTLK